MPANIYDIDFKKIIRWWTPYELRTDFWLTWLGVLIIPINRLYQSFLLYRNAKLYDLMITPQVCYLEAMLNDRWDFINRGIYIDDAPEHAPLYLYQDEENHPIDLYTEAEGLPVWLYTEGEAEGGDYADDFIVWVPASVVFDAVEMRSMVMRKRLPGMRFTIQTY